MRPIPTLHIQVKNGSILELRLPRSTGECQVRCTLANITRVTQDGWDVHNGPFNARHESQKGPLEGVQPPSEAYQAFND